MIRGCLNISLRNKTRRRTGSDPSRNNDLEPHTIRCLDNDLGAGAHVGRAGHIHVLLLLRRRLLLLLLDNDGRLHRRLLLLHCLIEDLSTNLAHGARLGGLATGVSQSDNAGGITSVPSLIHQVSVKLPWCPDHLLKLLQLCQLTNAQQIVRIRSHIVIVRREVDTRFKIGVGDVYLCAACFS